MKHSPIPYAAGLLLVASSALAAPMPDSGSSVFSPRAAQSAATQPAPGADLTQAPQGPLSELPDRQLADQPDRRLADLPAKLAQGDLLAPCTLFARNLGPRLELDALCAPIAPVPGENPSSAKQARFPLLSLAW